MSLLIRDMLLVCLVTLAGAGVIYAQYFAPYNGQSYLIWAWGAFVIVSAMFLIFSELGQAFISYLKAARSEIRKVVWPKRDEVVKTTLAVGVAVVIFSILVSILDSILVRIFSGLIG